MTTLHEVGGRQIRPLGQSGSERRRFRRHDLETCQLTVERSDVRKRDAEVLGQLVDLSAGGLRIRTEQKDVRPDSQIRVRLELPSYAGISPFVDTSGAAPRPKNEWVGWMSVARVKAVDARSYEVAGPLMEMDEMDRGMLGLYLSTQPLAA